VITRQESVVSDQLTRMTCLQQELTSTRSSLSELRAERQCHDVEFEHLINSLRLDLHSVSTQHSSHLSLHSTVVLGTCEASWFDSISNRTSDSRFDLYCFCIDGPIRNFWIVRAVNRHS